MRVNLQMLLFTFRDDSSVCSDNDDNDVQITGLPQAFLYLLDIDTQSVSWHTVFTFQISSVSSSRCSNGTFVIPQTYSFCSVIVNRR